MIYKRRVPAWLGGVVNKMIKNVLQSKRWLQVKIVHFKKDGSVIGISWIIDLS